MSFSRNELETAASEVLQTLKTLPELAAFRVAVIGGLALWNYIPEGRKTEDIDLIINVDGAHNNIKSRLVNLNNSPFTVEAWIFWYNLPSGKRIKIDIFASWQLPYLPPSSKVISAIEVGVLPYISAIDLVVFKIYCCGQRLDTSKGHRDARDAADLLEQETTSSPLTLAAVQKSTVEAGLPDVIEYAVKPESWWKQRLGL